MLLESEAPPELIANATHEMARRIPGHFLEFLREMGLVVVVVIEFVHDDVV